MEVVTPIIHMNGDRKDTLIRNLEDAYRAVRAAQLALRECAPNGRNYYPEPGRFERARAQYDARMAQLERVIESLDAEARKIEDETRGNRA